MSEPLRHPVFDETRGEGVDGICLLPSDPVCAWSECYYTPAAHQPDEAFPVYLRNTPRCKPRAVIQRMAADELGCDFGYIRVLARWGRIFTRQRAWDEGGSDRWLDLWLLKHKVGYYSKEATYYYDAEYSLPPAQRRDPQVPEPPAAPPQEWLPQEDLPGWELCAPYDAGAMPIYIVETM